MRNPKPVKINDALMGEAERDFAHADALIFGAARLLRSDANDPTMWGREISIDVALNLLTVAKFHQAEALKKMDQAKTPRPKK